MAVITALYNNLVWVASQEFQPLLVVDAPDRAFTMSSGVALILDTQQETSAETRPGHRSSSLRRVPWCTSSTTTSRCGRRGARNHTHLVLGVTGASGFSNSARLSMASP